MIALPKISIVTPSFNQGQFLEQTIDSVLNQGYNNLEYIIIDGGSIDQSVEIIRKYAKHLKYWVSEPDSGQSNAINKGLKHCSGDVFNWINSDDYYAPNALHLVGEYFKNPDVKVLAARSNLFGSKTNSYISGGTWVFENNLAKTIGWARIDQPETFFRLPLIQSVGLLNEKLHYLMDRDLWIRYLLKFGLDGILQTDDVLVNFRLHEDSKTVSQSGNFNLERNSYYHTMALNSNGLKEAKIIQSMFNCQLLTDIPNIENPDLSAEVFNYFLLLLADEQYQGGMTQNVNRLIKNVNIKLLQEPDKKLLRKIRFRNQYLPLFMLRMLRKK